MTKFYRMLRTAMRALLRNPLRALLTTLGIIIGVGAVIAMMEIGHGASSEIQKTISKMGANVLIVFPGTATSAGASFGAGSAMTLTPDDCKAVMDRCPSVRAAAPIVRARAQVVYGNRNWVPQQISGTTAAFLDIRDWTDLSEGAAFTDRDVLTGRCVCLVGQTLVRELFQGESPIGKEIRIRNVPFRIVGVLSRKGANMGGQDQDDVLLAPWTSIKYRVTGSSATTANQSASTATSSTVNSLSSLYPSSALSLYPAQSDVQAADTPMPVRFTNVDQIVACARSAAEIPGAMQEMNELLRERHNLRVGEPDDFTVRDMTEMASAFSTTTTLVANVLVIVATLSLIVGGVGIMNIMLVSVTERTREIGLRMAVGARARDILGQFLTEAVTLCLIGGLIGIAIGVFASWCVWYFKHWPVESSPTAVAVSVIVSGAVGVIFGFYPAWKASRLDPIEALRYE